MNSKELNAARKVVEQITDLRHVPDTLGNISFHRKASQIAKDAILQEIDREIKDNKEGEEHKKKVKDLEIKEEDLEIELKKTRKKLKKLKTK